MRIRREIAGALVHIDPEDAGKEILVDELAIQPEVVWILLITGGVIQIAIGTEVEVAAVVIGSLIKLLQQDEFGIGICDVGIAGAHFEPRDALMIGATGDADSVSHVEIAVGGVAGMERESEQSVFLVSATFDRLHWIASGNNLLEVQE